MFYTILYFIEYSDTYSFFLENGKEDIVKKEGCLTTEVPGAEKS